MKRITTLMLAMALVLGSVSVAKADGIDVKVKGQWDFSFGWVDNAHFRKSYIPQNGFSNRTKNEKGTKGDNFQAMHRVRTQANFITSEYLQGVLQFEIGNITWGNKKQGGALDTDGINVETKLAYLDWVIPNTEVAVRMGLQTLTLPSTPMGSPLFDADVAGIVVSAPITDWLSAALFWIRPFDHDTYNGDRDLSDETDAFGILLPMAFDGVKFTPWFIWGRLGVNSGAYEYLFATGKDKYFGNTSAGYPDSQISDRDHAQAWWVGGHFELSLFEPLVFNLEAIYGNLSRANLEGFAGLNRTAWGSTMDIKAEGWIIAATLDYKLDFMTPGIFGWYASGDDDDAFEKGEIGRMPVLGNDSGSFSPTSFGTAGYYGINQWSNSGTISGTGTGTWGVGIQLADISFIEDLKHTIRVAYYRGTNDADNIKSNNRNPNGRYLQYAADRFYLTDDDYVWEVNFDHQYKIYENLTAVLELGYLRLHSDKDTWGGSRPGSGLKENDNAYKAQIAFRYSF